MTLPPVQAPARYVPVHAVAFTSSSGELSAVTSASPLPIAMAAAAPAPAISGETTANAVVGPFAPTLDRAVALILSGTWTGTVVVQRSIDGGVTRHPLTVAGMPWARFTANACEAVWEENDSAGTIYLDVSIASGSLKYRLGH